MEIFIVRCSGYQTIIKESIWMDQKCRIKN